jgi:ribosomal protein L29
LLFYTEAPAALTDTQKAEIRNDPRLLRLCQKHNRLSKMIKKDFSTIKAAQGTRRYKKYKKLQARINSLKQKLKAERFDKATKHFWATVYTKEVNKQLQGILLSTELLVLPTIKYELKEQATVAKLFLECRNNLNEFQLFQIHIEIIRNLTILCRRQETYRSTTKTRRYLSYEDKSSKATETPDDVKIDLSVPDKQMLLKSTFYCLFCRYDEEAGPQKRNKLFSCIDSLCKHIRIQHLEYMRPNDGFICLYQGCMTSLKGTMHFLNHTALEHGLCL